MRRNVFNLEYYRREEQPVLDVFDKNDIVFTRKRQTYDHEYYTPDGSCLRSNWLGIAFCNKLKKYNEHREEITRAVKEMFPNLSFDWYNPTSGIFLDDPGDL